MDGVISVIVPVYNVAAYLPQCLDSILAQSYRSLQIIVVNDGSTDNSGAVCDAYAAKDSRIRVIHQKNAGAAAAKNAGLRVASGEYLSFVDSDDFLEPGAYAHMVGQLEKHQADVIRCSYRYEYQDRAVDNVPDPQVCRMSGKQFLAQFVRNWQCGILWDKLYRRSVFEGIFFEEGHKIDDEYFTYQGIMNAETVICDAVCVYHYRKRRSSVMGSPESGKQIVIDSIDYIRKRRRNVVNRFPELRKDFDNHFLDAMLLFSRNANSTEKSIALIKENLRNYFREKGHTVPNIKLWPAIIRLYFTDMATLLRQREKKEPVAEADMYFE